VTYSRDDPRYWLGRGLEEVPGKPFGWSTNMERRAIRDHLIRRGYDPNSAALHFRIEAIRCRLHRDKPTWRERQQAWLARQPRPTGAPLGLTWPEIEHLASLFAGANHPLSASIGEKAVEALAKRDA
jgi:hypothetical protein